MSITVLLLAGIGGLVTLAIAAVLFAGLYAAGSNTMGLLRDRAQDSMVALTELTSNHLRPAAVNVHAVAELLETTDLHLTDELIEKLRMTLLSAPQLRGMGVFIDNGEAIRLARERLIFRGTVKEAGFDFDRMKQAMEVHQVNWGPPTWVIELEETVIYARAPIIIDGVPRGLVVTGISTRELSRYLDELSTSVGTAFIMDEQKRLIAHPKMITGFSLEHPEDGLPDAQDIEDDILKHWVSGDFDPANLLNDEDRNLDAQIVHTNEGDFVILSQELPGLYPQKWTLGVAVSTVESDVFLHRLYRMGIAGVVVLLLTLLALLWLARAIRLPVTALAIASERIRRLDLNPPPILPATRITELNDASGAFDRMVTALHSFESYVPRRLVFRIMRDGNSEGLAARTRQVTVMFTDIPGFTTLSEQLNATEVAKLLNDHFTLIAGCVEAEEGTIDKYIGDSVMAFWGAPSKQPDHAARAIRAAQAVAETVRADNAQRRADCRQEIRIRIGIHSGPALAGNIGAPGRINYTLVGDTVNAANRIEQLGKSVDAAAEVIVLASGDAVEAAKIAPETLTSAGAHDLRGRTMPVTLYRMA
jgi:class 3 adenylate cyclase